MSRERGFSVIELLVATALLGAICGVVLGLLHDGLAGTPVLEEASDLHQRGRVVADALAGELRSAAAGTPSGALSRYFAAVDPRRPADPAGSAAPDVITLRYVPDAAPHARLAQPLAAGVPVAVIDGAGCPAGATACGFVSNTTAVVFDASGNFDVVNVDAIGPGVLSISDVIAGRSVSYPAGSEIAEVRQVTFVVDSSSRQLRRAEPGGSFAVADNVTSLRFDYFDSGMSALPLARFADGPFVGSGATAFDADLLLIAVIRATVTIETGVDAMRGTDSALFARPGTATGRRMLPDVVQRIEVALRNRNAT